MPTRYDVEPRFRSGTPRALGYRARTDAIDAVLPVRFIETIRPRPEAETRAPRGLVGRRRQVVRLLELETAVKVALRLLDGIGLPGLRQLILVSVFRVREWLTLAQEPYAAKGHEITALPRLRDRMVLGTAVTIDTAGCQVAIVQALRSAGDQVLAQAQPAPSANGGDHSAIYHQPITEGNLISNLRTYLPLIGHIHTAGVPGRHELADNEIDYRAVFKVIDESDYTGYVGLEFRSSLSEAEALAQAVRIAEQAT